jgi:hypothetical protein
MPFLLTDVKVAHFPSDAVTNRALDDFGLPENKIRESIQTFVCRTQVVVGQGYQQDLAHELELHLTVQLTRLPGLHSGTARYSPRLNEKADLAISRNGSISRVFFEVEFRPNVEKDLVKFQIGANNNALAAAVLILASNRNAINRGYTTMPEFQEFERVIAELAPRYPLIVYGITGQHD